ncbi:MAG: hypothetical protein V3U24_00345, partial [Candidatus Neomarinimicrobiota bacterium]
MGRVREWRLGLRHDLSVAPRFLWSCRIFGGVLSFLTKGAPLENAISSPSLLQKRGEGIAPSLLQSYV